MCPHLFFHDIFPFFQSPIKQVLKLCTSAELHSEMLTFKFQILLKHLQVRQEGNSHPHPYFGGLKLCQ